MFVLMPRYWVMSKVTAFKKSKLLALYFGKGAQACQDVFDFCRIACPFN